MPKVTKYINTLNNLYSSIGNEWVNQNSLVLNYAKNSKLVIGGSIALAIGAANPFKIPGDIDLFTNNNEDALNFISYLTKYLSGKKGSFYRIDVNNETPRVLPGVLNHYRIKVPFWKPICVMTVSKPIRKYLYHRAPVQFYDDVIAAAKEASKIDNKNRLPKEEQETKELKKFRKAVAGGREFPNIQRVYPSLIPSEDVQVAPMTDGEILSPQRWVNVWETTIGSLAPSDRERELINSIPAVTDVPNLLSEDIEDMRIAIQNSQTIVTMDSIPSIDENTVVDESPLRPIAEDARQRRNRSSRSFEAPNPEFLISISGGTRTNRGSWSVESDNHENTPDVTYQGFYDTVVNEADRISTQRNNSEVVGVDPRTFEPIMRNTLSENILININTSDPGIGQQVEINRDYYNSRLNEAITMIPRREGETEEELQLTINTWIYHSQPNITPPQRLRTNWTIDAAQDLQTMHDNIGQEFRIIDRDIDRELLEFAREQRFNDPYSHCERTLVS